MYSHEPPGYLCPFCDWLRGNETEYKRNADIILQTDKLTAFISPKWWANNPGSIIIIPNKHIENIYSMPDKLLADIYSTVKQVAIGIRSTYENCEGTSTRQHNEPAGNQDVWHFHVHVFPRFQNDRLYQNHDLKHFVSPEERLPYAITLREYLAEYAS